MGRLEASVEGYESLLVQREASCTNTYTIPTLTEDQHCGGLVDGDNFTSIRKRATGCN